MYFWVIDIEICGLEGGIVEIVFIDVMDGVLSNLMSDLVSLDWLISFDVMVIYYIMEEMVEGKLWIVVVVRKY